MKIIQEKKLIPQNSVGFVFEKLVITSNPQMEVDTLEIAIENFEDYNYLNSLLRENNSLYQFIANSSLKAITCNDVRMAINIAIDNYINQTPIFFDCESILVLIYSNQDTLNTSFIHKIRMMKLLFDTPLQETKEFVEYISIHYKISSKTIEKYFPDKSDKIIKWFKTNHVLETF